MTSVAMGTSPRVQTSRRRINYTASAWHVHHFEIYSGAGEVVCRAAALRVQGAVLVWLGGAGEPRLSEAALGVPGAGAGATLATPLLGGEGASAALARRLAASLAKPVYVCCGAAFDRLTAPLVERALVAEIKSRPHCF